MNLPRICIRCLIISSLLVVACNKKADPPPIDTTTVPQLTISTLLTGYEIIWGFDFLPNGDLLFTEKQGKSLSLQ